MAKKYNLLIVGDYNRNDFINLFKSSQQYFNFYFLEFTSHHEIKCNHFRKYGKSIFWGNFHDAFDLLNKVKPKKVLFFFIESYFHVSLNLTCKVIGIPTYHIDHGIRDTNVNIRLEELIIPQKNQSKVQTTVSKLLQVFPRIKARLFLINTLSKLPPAESSFLKLYMQVRRGKTYTETFKIIDSHLRVADVYLAFSLKVYETHKKLDHLPADQKVKFIGVPTYDHLSKVVPQHPAEQAVIFIDQGLADRGILGWDRDTYKLFIKEFSEKCTNLGFTVYAKLHPTQPLKDRDLWQKATGITVINDNQLTEKLSKTRIIIGFFSTYLLPLVAMEHTTVLTLENHPAGKLDVSKSFIDAGVAHPIYDLQDLDRALDQIEQLHQQQLPNKKKFTEEWLYKFDGKSGERLRDILLQDGL